MKVSKPTVLQRFHAGYLVMEHWEDPCWVWYKATDKDGYGVIQVNSQHAKAHRFSFLQHKGFIPSKWHVCHTCDNPSCVNPEHLFVGTSSDNRQDSIRKGRSPICDQAGKKNPNVKITAALALEIYNRCYSGQTQKYIAEKLGVTRSNVNNIKFGRTWVWLTGHKT